jgi:hypothetical protein
VRIAQDFAAAGRDEPVKWLLWRATDMDLDALIEITDELPLQTLALRELARLRGFALENADFEIFSTAK